MNDQPLDWRLWPLLAAADADAGVALLAQSGLYSRGFLQLNEAVLVERYQQCLELLGLERSGLKSFRIDKMGWSPEIAQEKGNSLYLAAGVENPFAIIVSPDQRGLTAYLPHNSYDATVLEAYFKQFAGAIADITSVAAVAVEIDEGLTTYESPEDLMLIDTVSLHSLTSGDWGRVAGRQRALVARFMLEPGAWADPDLRSALTVSAQQEGDLRARRLIIPEFKFDNLGSFYTQAFGGVFVLRQLKQGRQLLVLEDRKHFKLSVESLKIMCHLETPGLLDGLLAEGLITLDLDAYRADPRLWEDKLECLWVNSLCEAYPDINYQQLSAAQKRSLLAQLGPQLVPLAHELERLGKKLSSGVRSIGEISPGLKFLLCRPAERLWPAERALVRRLLCRFQKWDLLGLFAADRFLFLQEYLTWTPAKQQWAISKLSTGTDIARK